MPKSTGSYEKLLKRMRSVMCLRDSWLKRGIGEEIGGNSGETSPYKS